MNDKGYESLEALKRRISAMSYQELRLLKLELDDDEVSVVYQLENLGPEREAKHPGWSVRTSEALRTIRAKQRTAQAYLDIAEFKNRTLTSLKIRQ